ncbi:MAG: hypothetical protein J0L52_08945 [Caulobacterales bacterium]|nr:hypothetical protein [Caulobacterales bacterium]
MSPRPASVLTVISLAALAVAGCNPRLPASRDAPNPTLGGPPLRVDLIYPGDQPEGPPIPPADAPVDLVESEPETAPLPAPVAGPAPQVPVTPVVDHESQAPSEDQAPAFTPVVHVEPEPAPAGPVPSHCLDQEATLYSCRFQDGRMLSVCMGDQIAYRFGRPGAPELDLVRELGSDAVSYEVERRRGEGRQTQVRFQNGNYDYVVFSQQSGRGEAMRPGPSGVQVRRAGREIARFECPTASEQTRIPVSMPRDAVHREPSDLRLRGR